MAPPEKRHSDRMRDQKKEIELDVHMVSMENLFERFDSSLQGLTASQAEKNLEKYGPNTLTPPPKTPEWIKFVKQLFGGFSTLLWCGAILCFIAYVLQYETEDYPELDNVWLGVVLILVVVLTGCFTYYQEAKACRIMESFKDMVPQQVTTCYFEILKSR